MLPEMHLMADDFFFFFFFPFERENWAGRTSFSPVHGADSMPVSWYWWDYHREPRLPPSSLSSPHKAVTDPGAGAHAYFACNGAVEANQAPPIKCVTFIVPADAHTRLSTFTLRPLQLWALLWCSRLSTNRRASSWLSTVFRYAAWLTVMGRSSRDEFVIIWLESGSLLC